MNKRKGFANKKDVEVVNILRKWLDKRHYASSIEPDNKSLFCIVGTDPQNRRLIIYKPKENPSVIYISLFVDEGDINKNIPQPYLKRARLDIAIEMARIGLRCHSEPPMYVDQELQCDEFLTESVFWNAVDKIRQGHVLIDVTLKLAKIFSMIEKKVQNQPDSQKQNEKAKS